ncbi:hypothetical protein Egran_05483 [Elaphomyces granulatus]|uniref:Uncharacterized protein n=1 Tax=Elaphomyces granulatus TaxID=519963 RepID=A0A232LRG0_9EURO|nr:hypothetical protein Egran_05483 [Elaphomyces granulatus]
MNVGSLRSSRSSYGDPRYLSAYSNGPSTLPFKVLLDGYRGVLDPLNDDKSQYSAASPNPTRSPPLLDVNDPVVMHLLTEIAMGDSKGYEVLSFEEVEDLKREHALLSTRIEATRRKLALEMKLRDAAQSLSRLYSTKVSWSSEDFSANSTTNSRLNGDALSRRNDLHETNDDADDELAASTQKCGDLAQELWRLERQADGIRKRLLEHTAGILQMTHKGLKKNVNRSNTDNNNFLRTPENTYGNGRGSILDFDDRSLYKTADHLDEFGGSQSNQGRNSQTAPEVLAVDSNIIRSTEKKLEMLNARLHEMILQDALEEDIESIPYPSSNSGSPNPAVTMQVHLEYLENSLNIMQTRRVQERDASTYEAEAQMRRANSQLHAILKEVGVFAQTPPPTPNPSEENLQTHISYLISGFETLQRRVEGIQEQKSILTTQIQQQRELNTKSDAQRDSHIADLTQQLSQLKEELELSEREEQSLRDELTLMMEQLDTERQEMALNGMERSRENYMALNTEKEARAHAEKEISRLQATLQQLTEAHSQDEDATNLLNAERETRMRVESELSHLQEALTQATEALSQDKNVMNLLNAERETRMRAESEVSHLQEALSQDKNAMNLLNAEREARMRAESEVLRLQEALTEATEALSQDENATNLLNAERETRMHAESEVLRLQEALTQATEALSRDENVTNLLNAERETRMRAESEVSRLQEALTQTTKALSQDENATNLLNAERETRIGAEREVSRLEEALNQSTEEHSRDVSRLQEALQQATEERSHDEHVADLLNTEMETRMLAENEVSRLQEALKHATDALPQDENATNLLNAERETRMRAESEVSRLQEALKQAAEARSRDEDNADHVNTETKTPTQAEDEILRLQDALQQANEARSKAEEGSKHLRAELAELEGEVARAQTELTVVKAELDGAYGTRAERAAQVAANPAIQREIDDLTSKNISLNEELAALKAERVTRATGDNSGLQQRVEMLEKELRETIEDYEVMTKASIEFEKERERFESIIDELRDRCESLEAQLSDEHIRWMGINSDGASETTSTMVLKNEFKKMMRDTRAENMKLLKASDPPTSISTIAFRLTMHLRPNKRSVGD